MLVSGLMAGFLLDLRKGSGTVFSLSSGLGLFMIQELLSLADSPGDDSSS